MSARDRLKRIAPLVALVRLGRALVTPIGRGRLLAGTRDARLFQPATVTRMNRHPALVALVATHLAQRDAPRLLSFGCSTGEEAFTLADYLPGAAIDAIDANPACIAQAQATQAQATQTQATQAQAATEHPGRIRFACADTPDAFAPDLYDAVLCLSVLRHGDLDARVPERCTALLPFARFAAAVAALDTCVRPGGLLILWGCNFRFGDTPTAAGYRVIARPTMRAHPGPFYGPDDRLLPVPSYADFAFLKIDPHGVRSSS